MIQQPAYLKKGDKIAIISPAKKLTQSIDSAITILEQWGLEVITGKMLYASHHQFAGPDEQRAEDLQAFLDDPDIKAIIASRGGYGMIRIIDKLDFTRFKSFPKWIIGFSDITVLLSHLLAKLNVRSIHGQMPMIFDEASPESLESLRKSLFGEPLHYSYSGNFKNKSGTSEGILIGGNLTLLVNLEGSVSAPDYDGKILFLEDVGEYEYAIDRMLRMLKRGGKLTALKGLIVGSFNGIRPQETPFGASPEEIIEEIVKEYDYPVCYHFPTGHIADNRAMIIGNPVQLTVEQDHTILKFI